MRWFSATSLSASKLTRSASPWPRKPCLNSRPCTPPSKVEPPSWRPTTPRSPQWRSTCPRPGRQDTAYLAQHEAPGRQGSPASLLQKACCCGLSRHQATGRAQLLVEWNLPPPVPPARFRFHRFSVSVFQLSRSLPSTLAHPFPAHRTAFLLPGSRL